MMEAYFDNSATTRCYVQAAELVTRLMLEDFGNPAAMHQKGVEAEKYVKEASQTLARLLKVTPKEILYTSGGTESDNLAIIGAALAARRSGKHLITTAVEHPAVSQPMSFLEKEGFEVTVLPVDDRGVVSMEALSAALRPDTILVSAMYVNNETGSVNPIREMAALIHAQSPKALFHVDAVQAFGKYEIYPARDKIDLLSVSSHKIHGPKGAGFLYVRNGVRLQPLMLGGGQQNGLRSGTENVPGCAGMALAAQLVYQHLEENRSHLYALKEQMARGLSSLPDVRINGMELQQAAPHIMSVTFDGIRSEVLLHALEERGIYVSAGSACSSHKRKPSAVLTAMGLDKAQIESTVRISFSEENRPEEVEYALSVLYALVPMLRRYSHF